MLESKLIFNVYEKIIVLDCRACLAERSDCDAVAKPAISNRIVTIRTAILVLQSSLNADAFLVVIIPIPV